MTMGEFCRCIGESGKLNVPDYSGIEYWKAVSSSAQNQYWICKVRDLKTPDIDSESLTSAIL